MWQVGSKEIEIPFSGVTIDYGQGEFQYVYLAQYSHGKLQYESKYLADQAMFLDSHYENNYIAKREYYGLRGTQPIKPGTFIKREIYEDGVLKKTVTADDVKNRKY